MNARLSAALLLAAALDGCSRSNNLLLGRVQATAGGHRIVVTDCYRITVPPPATLAAAGGIEVHFKPCKDADIWIRGGQLYVNGRAYGPIGPSDGVLVDHGVVSVQRASAQIHHR